MEKHTWILQVTDWRMRNAAAPLLTGGFLYTANGTLTSDEYEERETAKDPIKLNKKKKKIQKKKESNWMRDVWLA